MNVYQIIEDVANDSVICTKCNTENLPEQKIPKSDVRFTLYGIMQEVDWTQSNFIAYIESESCMRAISDYRSYKYSQMIKKLEMFLDACGVKEIVRLGEKMNIEAGRYAKLKAVHPGIKQYFAYPFVLHTQWVDCEVSRIWTIESDYVYVSNSDCEKLTNIVLS